VSTELAVVGIGRSDRHLDWVAELREKVQLALDENRILVLGCQVLLGFEFRSAFENGFEKLPRFSQNLKVANLTALVLAFGLLLAPSTYHRIVERGEDTPRFLRVVSAWMWPALLPFVFGLSTDLFVAGQEVLGRAGGTILGLCSFGLGFAFLYVLEAVQRVRRADRIRALETMDENGEREQTRLQEKITHVLAEARLVLPGAQALLGFQLATFLQESFESLPGSSKLLHLASTCCVALAVILLLAPAAYHRIVERGETTEHMHQFASAMILAATIPLALGICGDFFVILRKVLRSDQIAVLSSGAMLIVIFAMWFGVSWVAKLRQRRSPMHRHRKEKIPA
jgi:hypothetical protein